MIALPVEARCLPPVGAIPSQVRCGAEYNKAICLQPAVEPNLVAAQVYNVGRTGQDEAATGLESTSGAQRAIFQLRAGKNHPNLFAGYKFLDRWNVIGSVRAWDQIGSIRQRGSEGKILNVCCHQALLSHERERVRQLIVDRASPEPRDENSDWSRHFPFAALSQGPSMPATPSGSDRPSFPDTTAGRGPQPRLSQTAGKRLSHIPGRHRRAGCVVGRGSEYPSESLPLAGPLASCHDRRPLAYRCDRKDIGKTPG